MSRFIEGANRCQRTLFPESLDEYVGEDNAIRVVDVFVEELDLSGLGFQTEPSDTGRPGYHPATMLKLYIYGYLNRIASSRRLEREAQRNLELMWLTGRLAPDFKTIADFRKDNGGAIRLVCREFVMLCRKLELFSDAFVAIDGGKFKAVNSPDRNVTRENLKRRLLQVDGSIERYLVQMASADRDRGKVAKATRERLQEKVARLKQEVRRLKKLEVRLRAQPQTQISLTDPDARSMASKRPGSAVVGYNVQFAVDTKHHLIVEHEVTNVGHDRAALAHMATRTKDTLDVEALGVVCDRGYWNDEELLACEQAGVTAYLPKPQTSGSTGKGRFSKRDFCYIAEDEEYECPAGERLRPGSRLRERQQVIQKYFTSACTRCALKARCTTSKYRRITRWEHEGVMEAAEARLALAPEMMGVRRQSVEHPIGTLKSWMGHTHFLTRRLRGVSAEMSLNVLAYNLKRMLNLIGPAALISAIQEV